LPCEDFHSSTKVNDQNLGPIFITLGCLGILLELFSPDFTRLSCIDQHGSNFSYYGIYILMIFIGTRIIRKESTL